MITFETMKIAALVCCALVALICMSATGVYASRKVHERLARNNVHWLLCVVPALGSFVMGMVLSPVVCYQMYKEAEGIALYCD
jgi:hypothetical protein